MATVSAAATAAATAAADEDLIVRSSSFDDGRNAAAAGSSDWYEIVKNADGSVYNPFGPSNLCVFLVNVICCVVGIYASVGVLNRLVVTCRRDAWRPRHVLLFASIVSCMLTLLTHCFIPSVYYVWPDDDYLCRVFVALFRLPYIQFLFNLYMSIMDRYVAVTRSIWHRTAFTLNQCIVWLSILNGLLAILVKWSFISNVLPVECAFQFIHGLTIFVTILVLFILCTAFLIAVFVITWRQLPRAARAIPVPTLRSRPPIIDQQQQQPPPPTMNPAAEIEYVPLRDLLLHLTAPPTSTASAAAADAAAVPSSSSLDEERANNRLQQSPPPLSVPSVQQQHQALTNNVNNSSSSSSSSSSSNLRRMELEVTKHFLFTLLPLFVIVIPYLVLSFCILITYAYFNNHDDPFGSALVSYIAYFGLLPTIHVTIYPLANLYLNKEINSLMMLSSSSSSCCCSSSSSSSSSVISLLSSIICRCFFVPCCHCCQQQATTTAAAAAVR